MTPEPAELRVYLADNGTTLLCRGCNQKALSANDSYHDICMKRCLNAVTEPATAAPRHFIAGADVREVSYQELTQHMRVPGDVVAGLDLLTDDGMDAERAASLLMVAHRDGRDAEAFARHVLKLRKAIRP